MNSWQPVLDCLQAGDFAQAIELLDTALSSEPLDVDGRVLRAVAHAASGSTKLATHELWKALAIAPRSEGTRRALTDMFVSGEEPPPIYRDFSLASGERQTASDVAAIREDHRSRYEFAANWIRRHIGSAHTTTGVDLFCGNGYGSRIVSETAGCRMIGIDGSSDAVMLAEQSYGGARTVYRQAYFPFDLVPNTADFAICFESIEHVQDYEKFIRSIDQMTAGPLLLSFPIERNLNFDLNKDLFKYHYRHFNIEDIESLLNPLDRRIVVTKGQAVYTMENGRLSGLLPERAMALTALRDDSQFAVIVATKG